MPIDKAKRDELRALAEKATPGPWRIYGPGTSDPTEIHAPDPDYDDPDFGVVVFGGDLCRGEIDDDAAFILAAREAVPALLDEVERLERERIPRGGEEAAGPDTEVLVAEAETCHRILRRIRSAAGLPDRYPSFAAKPPSDSDGEEIATRVAAALSLLREIEFCVPDPNHPDARWRKCPACGWGWAEGKKRHDVGCRLAALLK